TLYMDLLVFVATGFHELLSWLFVSTSFINATSLQTILVSKQPPDTDTVDVIEKKLPIRVDFILKARHDFLFSHGFLIAVIFLIFDVEITLLFPLASIIHLTNIFS
ncbi:NADH-ubiquinone oxidoreductase chain 3-like 5, partial [Homarus americanus]